MFSSSRFLVDTRIVHHPPPLSPPNLTHASSSEQPPNPLPQASNQTPQPNSSLRSENPRPRSPLIPPNPPPSPPQNRHQTQPHNSPKQDFALLLDVLSYQRVAFVGERNSRILSGETRRREFIRQELLDPFAEEVDGRAHAAVHFGVVGRGQVVDCVRVGDAGCCVVLEGCGEGGGGFFFGRGGGVV